ncbi:MAG: hypothetical protein ETSY1_24435 [Candidatus Entotheonella factor]|uniref:TIR domain-containing protein n=1 Tax=Entotheonella factor TaxID=1429438 RepID=W4LGH3_ENTF1|nr:MAG: hypothetical protein ETSY1_24435 [Candidatus Entotheonella factor]
MHELSQKQYDIFISYSRLDREWVQAELMPRLERHGFQVCIDYRDFEIGTPILHNIEYAVDNCRHTILVLTPSWLESEWTDFESLLVGTSDPTARRRKLIPLLLKPCALPSRITILTYADFTQHQDHDTQFSRLLNQLQITSIDVNSPISQAELSPFVAGPPIMYPRQFFGRERELRRLFNLWKRHPLQNAALIGPRRSGKTSLLLYLKNIFTLSPEQRRADQQTDWLPQPEQYRWIFVDFQNPRLSNREGIFRYLLEQLNMPVLRPCDLESFIEVVSRHLQNPTVILLDEIGVALQRYTEFDDFFWESLRSLATNQVNGNLAFVLTADQAIGQLARHSGIGSPFFNIFGYTSTLGPLDEPEAHGLIRSSPLPFPVADVNWILEQSQRWPPLLQILCRERLLSLEGGEVDSSWREEGLRQIQPFRYLLELG